MSVLRRLWPPREDRGARRTRDGSSIVISANFMPSASIDAPAARRTIAIATIGVGGAGLVLLPSDALRSHSTVVLIILALSTIPVATLFLLAKKLPFIEGLFVIYADIGIVTALATMRSAYLAMPGLSLFLLVAVFVVAYGSVRTLIVHTTFSLVVLIVFVGLSIDQGIELSLVASRTLTIVSMFAAPIALRVFVNHLRLELLASHTDHTSGLLNYRGIDHRTAVLSENREQTDVLGIELIQIEDPDSPTGRSGRPSMLDAVVELSARLQSVVPEGTIVGRLDTHEIVYVVSGSPHDVIATLSDITTAVDGASLRSMRATVRSRSAIETVEHDPDVSWVLQRLVTRARLDLQNSRLRTRSSPSNGEAVGSDSSPTHRIQDVIAAGGPDIVYQPVFRITDRTVVGYEALARFPAGFGATNVWFATANDVGLSVPLELSAIGRALAGSSALPPDAYLALNASAATILTTDLPALLADTASVRPVTVEVTEHDLIEDYEAFALATRVLQRAGVSISVDDVGTGYSGLLHVVEIKPDVLKLDASIVHNIDSDRARRAAAKSFIVLADELGADAIFEGVETEEELETVRALGGIMVQGFLLGEPMPGRVIAERNLSSATSARSSLPRKSREKYESPSPTPADLPRDRRRSRRPDR